MAILKTEPVSLYRAALRRLDKDKNHQLSRARTKAGQDVWVKYELEKLNMLLKYLVRVKQRWPHKKYHNNTKNKTKQNKRWPEHSKRVKVQMLKNMLDDSYCERQRTPTRPSPQAKCLSLVDVGNVLHPCPFGDSDIDGEPISDIDGEPIEIASSSIPACSPSFDFETGKEDQSKNK